MITQLLKTAASEHPCQVHYSAFLTRIDPLLNAWQTFEPRSHGYSVGAHTEFAHEALTPRTLRGLFDMTDNSASASLCPVDGRSIPSGRKRFCSAECAVKFKRAQMRNKREREHRHRWQCLDCGKRTRLGRNPVGE